MMVNKADDNETFMTMIQMMVMRAFMITTMPMLAMTMMSMMISLPTSRGPSTDPLFEFPVEPPAMARKSLRPRVARFFTEKGSSPFRPNS